MTYSQQDGARDRQPERAAIFVDFDNLYRTLGRLGENGSGRVELISEMVEALQRSLLEDRQTQSIVARAYADFGGLEGAGERAQRALYLQGIEAHFVPETRQENAAGLQLCVDAMDLLHHRSDISTFVLLTGRRAYLPLIRAFRRCGRRVLIVGLGEPVLEEGLPIEEGLYFPARDLLSGSSRRRLGPPAPAQATPSQDNLTEIEDPVLVETLEIIDEHFGQYEEVYLTPLLRKLSELLDERRYDPKNLISDLEDCRAVRLEKRQGFPHDYTVLILEEHHPTVARVLSGERSGTSYRHSYDDDADDAYSDDYEEYAGEYDEAFDADYRSNGVSSRRRDGHGEPAEDDASESADLEDVDDPEPLA